MSKNKKKIVKGFCPFCELPASTEQLHISVAKNNKELIIYHDMCYMIHNYVKEYEVGDTNER